MFRALRSFTMNGRRVNRYDLLADVPAHLQGTYLRARYIEPHQNQKGPSLSDMKRSDLLAYAEETGVTVPSGLKVADIRTLLEDS